MVYTELPKFKVHVDRHAATGGRLTCRVRLLPCDCPSLVEMREPGPFGEGDRSTLDQHHTTHLGLSIAIIVAASHLDY